jgi:ATP-dependent Clp protease ATP-binding subunit ClpB
VQSALRSHFRPEFLNRLDEIVVFHALSRENIRHIVELQFAHVRAMLADRRIALVLTGPARDALAAEGWDPSFGARPLKRTIQRRIQNPLAMKLLAGEFHDGDTIEIATGEGGYTFRIVPPAAQAPPVSPESAAAGATAGA